MFLRRSVIKIVSLTLLTLLIGTSSASFAEKQEEVQNDLSGRWKVLLTNSLTRKQVTFDLKEEDGRLRGTVSSNDMPEQKLDGRYEKNKGFTLWGTYYDRTGASVEYQFKGNYTGKQGEETLEGESEFFNRRYDFVGERAE